MSPKFKVRDGRFEPDFPVKAIIRNSRLRFSCYWLELSNISSTGLAFRYEGTAVIPIKIDDTLEITLDINCKIFERPIHLSAMVMHVTTAEELEESDDSLQIGLKILEVDKKHKVKWDEGIDRLTEETEKDQT